MGVDEMLRKMLAYSHHYDYRHLAKREVLEEAIKQKTYPFDPGRDFRIRVLSIHRDKQFYPQSLYAMLDDFTSLIAE
jgi:hypothetical protein